MLKCVESFKFWIKSHTIYDVHSPFLFGLINAFVDNSQQFYLFHSLKSNYYSKNTKIKLFKIIRYCNPLNLYLVHPIHALELQFLKSLNKERPLVEVNGRIGNFSPSSCLIIDAYHQKEDLKNLLWILGHTINNQEQIVVLLNYPNHLRWEIEKIPIIYNLLVFTADFLLLFSMPNYKGKRNYFIVSKFTKPWRMGFFN